MSWIPTAAAALPTIMSLFGHGKESMPYAGDLQSIAGQQNTIGNTFGSQGALGFGMANQFAPEYGTAQQSLYDKYTNLANGLTNSQRAMLLGQYLGPGNGNAATSNLNNTLAQLSQAGLAGPEAGGNNSSVAGAIGNVNASQMQNLMRAQGQLGQTEFQLPFTALEAAGQAAAAPMQAGLQRGFQGYNGQLGALGQQGNTVQQLMGASQQQRENQMQSDQATMGAAGGLSSILGQYLGSKSVPNILTGAGGLMGGGGDTDPSSGGNSGGMPPANVGTGGWPSLANKVFNYQRGQWEDQQPVALGGSTGQRY